MSCEVADKVFAVLLLAIPVTICTIAITYSLWQESDERKENE